MVALRGYKKLVKLNGVVATIVRYLPARRRWRVWLESCPYPDGGSGFKNVKRCRLVRNTADDTSDGTPESVCGMEVDRMIACGQSRASCVPSAPGLSSALDTLAPQHLCAHSAYCASCLARGYIPMT